MDMVDEFVDRGEICRESVEGATERRAWGEEVDNCRCRVITFHHNLLSALVKK